MNNVDLKGKRLLMVGGVQAVCEVIKEAQRLGIFVLETDYLIDSPAKKLADKSFMVSTTEPEEVAKLAVNEQVDGLFTCYTDLLLPYCQKACAILNKPFWGNERNIKMCIDKKLFKMACAQSGVPVVPWLLVTPQNVNQTVNELQFPLVIKPADNSGSRGVFKCFQQSDYLKMCEKAFQFSKNKELMVERLMDVNKEFSVYYFIHKGISYLTSMGDRYVDVVNVNSAPQAKGMLLPSVHLHEWMEMMDEKVKLFFKDNEMNEGYVFIQGFYDSGHFYLSEIGYRLNGGDTYKLVEQCSGVNIVELLLSYSLIGEVDESKVELFNPFFEQKAFLVTVGLRNGKIGSIKGIETILRHKNICGISQMHFVGDELDSPGTNAQVFAYFMCVGEDANSIKEAVNYVRCNLEVLDEKGNDLLVGVIDPETIVFQE